MKNLNHEHITLMAKQLFNEERNIKRLDGWFISQEIKMKNEKKYMNMSREMRSASYLYDIASELPLFVSDNNLFVGTQRDAFAMSYSLINPAFTVESFSGYCDPTAVFNDIEPNEEFTKERISKCREWFSKTEYAKALSKAYAPVEQYTKEVAFFIEQVTGHTICNFDLALKEGLSYIEKLVNEKLRDNSLDSVQKETYNAMLKTISATLVLTERYRKIVETKLSKGDKNDFVVQKATELGVSKIVFVSSKRCVVKYDGKDVDKKIARFVKIAKEAAEQCHRLIVPEIAGPFNVDQLGRVASEEARFVAYEEESQHSPSFTISGDENSVGIFIGPEGGIEEKEVKLLNEFGFKNISLGNRILRTETAAVYALSVIANQLEK